MSPYLTGAMTADAAVYSATRPLAIVRLSANQSIPNASTTTVTWGTTEADTGVACGLSAMVSGANIYARTAGVYHLAASVVFDLDTSGSRRVLEICRVSSGTTTVVARISQASSVNTYEDFPMSVTSVFAASSGDYFFVRVYHSAGNALSLVNNSGHNINRFSVIWAGPSS